MSNKWYDNEQLAELSKKCDSAYLNQDMNELSLLIDECYKQAHYLNNDALIRARYFYVAFTAHSNLIDLKRKNIGEQGLNEIETINAFETYHQKSLYLARGAFELLHEEIAKNEQITEEDFIYVVDFEWQLNVNYANFFYQKGRHTKATEILSVFDSNNDFPMGMAQLGIKIYELSRCHYNSSHQRIMLYKAYHYINRALESTRPYPEKEEMKSILNRYKSHIISMLGQDYLDKQFTINDFISCPKETTEDEIAYRKWTAENKLSLNILNDVFCSIEVAYDPLYLPSMTEKIDSNKAQNLFGLFNQLKQEYTSARFFAYEGLVHRELHFSDKEVFLVNTLDYPVYGLGIEKIKACYRAVYSMFDKIAFFLNEYYEIGLKRREVTYIRLFSPEKTIKDKVKIFDIAKDNLPLYGMWWLFKDVKNINVDIDGKIDKDNEYKHIDNVMHEISKVRNAMEHGCLIVLDFYCKEIADTQSDQLAYYISFADFEKLTMQLLKYIRELIILLVFSIKRAEEIKESQRNPNTIQMPMYTDRYDDEWKQIFE